MNKDFLNIIGKLKIKFEVDTFEFFKHCMKDNFFNAHIMVRMLAIDCYYCKNEYGWIWYNEMQQKRVADNPIIPKYMANHEKEFKTLIKSFEEKGFDNKYPIIVNKDFILIDGAHRLSLALYFKIKRIPIIIDKEYFDLNVKDYSFKWFEEHNMPFVKEEAIKMYKKINLDFGGK